MDYQQTGQKKPLQNGVAARPLFLSLHANITPRYSYANSVASSAEALRTTLCKAWPLAKAIKLAAASQKLRAVDDWEKINLVTHIIHGTGIFTYISHMLVDLYGKCR